MEDFERSEFYAKHKAPPKVGLALRVEREKRITVRTESGESLGFLPTERNYLAGCMAGGRTYAGHVTNVSSGAITRIRVDIAPTS